MWWRGTYKDLTDIFIKTQCVYFKYWVKQQENKNMIPGKFEHWPDIWWLKDLYCDYVFKNSYFIKIFLNIYGKITGCLGLALK